MESAAGISTGTRIFRDFIQDTHFHNLMNSDIFPENKYKNTFISICILILNLSFTLVLYRYHLINSHTFLKISLSTHKKGKAILPFFSGTEHRTLI